MNNPLARGVNQKLDDEDWARSRAEAIASGKKQYWSNRRCPQGHIGRRMTVNGSCQECLRQQSALRYQSGYRPDPERRRITMERWNNSSKAATNKRLWREKDPKNAWACAVVAGARTRARNKGLPFNIDKEYVKSITPDICPVFGVPFVFASAGGGTGSAALYSASLDRIEPALGYVVGNVAVISWKANLIKSSATADEIRAVADWLGSIKQGCVD